MNLFQSFEAVNGKRSSVDRRVRLDWKERRTGVDPAVTLTPESAGADVHAEIHSFLAILDNWEDGWRFVRL
jgi:hypothetical protein